MNLFVQREFFKFKYDTSGRLVNFGSAVSVTWNTDHLKLLTRKKQAQLLLKHLPHLKHLMNAFISKNRFVFKDTVLLW